MARSSVCREKLCHHTRIKFLYLVATSLPYGSHANAGAWRSCGKPVGRPSNSTRLAPSFPQWCRFVELVVSSYPARANDIVKAVHLLRQHGIAVGFPMQTADGQIIFPVGKDFTLTADQILELLERGELNAEGVRRLVEAQAATPMRRRAASS